MEACAFSAMLRGNVVSTTVSTIIVAGCYICFIITETIVNQFNIITTWNLEREKINNLEDVINIENGQRGGGCWEVCYFFCVCMHFYIGWNIFFDQNCLFDAKFFELGEFVEFGDKWFFTVASSLSTLWLLHHIYFYLLHCIPIWIQLKCLNHQNKNEWIVGCLKWFG